MICVHCGVGLAGESQAGLYIHENHLWRCQSGPAPYGHMGHPAMPCPSGTVNDCLGAREEKCEHVATSQGVDHA